MFLRDCSPRSSKARSTLPAASSWTRAETQMPPGFSQGFEAGGNIDTIAEDVAVLDDDVADINAYAPGNAGARRHLPLPGRGATQRVDNARELDEEPVAGGLDQPAAMAGDQRIDKLSAQRSEPGECAFLVGAD